jgi:hypothetical protein
MISPLSSSPALASSVRYRRDELVLIPRSVLVASGGRVDSDLRLSKQSPWLLHTTISAEYRSTPPLYHNRHNETADRRNIRVRQNRACRSCCMALAVPHLRERPVWVETAVLALSPLPVAWQPCAFVWRLFRYAAVCRFSREIRRYHTNRHSTLQFRQSTATVLVSPPRR